MKKNSRTHKNSAGLTGTSVLAASLLLVASVVGCDTDDGGFGPVEQRARLADELMEAGLDEDTAIVIAEAAPAEVIERVDAAPQTSDVQLRGVTSCGPGAPDWQWQHHHTSGWQVDFTSVQGPHATNDVLCDEACNACNAPYGGYNPTNWQGFPDNGWCVCWTL